MISQVRFQKKIEASGAQKNASFTRGQWLALKDSLHFSSGSGRSHEIVFADNEKKRRLFSYCREFSRTTSWISSEKKTTTDFTCLHTRLWAFWEFFIVLWNWKTFPLQNDTKNREEKFLSAARDHLWVKFWSEEKKKSSRIKMKNR